MNSDNIVYIYVLFEEFDDMNIRYVGKTTDVQRRLLEHMCDTGNTHKAHWVQSLRGINKKISIRVVETLTNATEEEWQGSERFWISFYRNQGCNLTNLDALNYFLTYDS